MLHSSKLRFACFLLGLNTYLISGRKPDYDVHCGCSQMALPSGDFEGVGLSSCPQSRTPDLIPGGAQAGEPLLSHQPPDRTGVRPHLWNSNSNEHSYLTL